MKRFILRYGVFTILILTAVILLAASRSFETRTKLPVHLFMTGPGECTAYVPYGDHVLPLRGDTVVVEQTAGGNVPFVVTDTGREPTSTVLRLRAVGNGKKKDTPFDGNTYSGGFVVAGRTTLMDHLLKSIRG